VSVTHEENKDYEKLQKNGNKKIKVKTINLITKRKYQIYDSKKTHKIKKLHYKFKKKSTNKTKRNKTKQNKTRQNKTMYKTIKYCNKIVKIIH
jgi:hypothetical protein